MVTFAQGYQQAVVDFKKLNSKLRDLNVKMKYKKIDKRYGSLQSLLKISMWMFMEIDSFVIFTTGNTSKLIKMFNLTKPDSIQFAKSIDVFLRASYLALFMFQVEGLLKMIRNELPNTSSSNKYYDITKDVLKISHPQNWQSKHDVLQAPALIRNCLHTSGVHTNKDTKVTVRGIDYEFFKDKKFQQASWDYIYMFIDELVNVLKEILTSSPTKKIKFIKI